MTRKNPDRYPFVKPRHVEWPPDDAQRDWDHLRFLVICPECGRTAKVLHYDGARCPMHPSTQMLNVGCQFRIPKRGSKAFEKWFRRFKSTDRDSWYSSKIIRIATRRS